MTSPVAFSPRCPFCGAEATSSRCVTCQRDPSAPRRICAKCQKQTPIAEPKCMHCQAVASSDMNWKIPLIVIMMIAAIVLGIALQSLK